MSFYVFIGMTLTQVSYASHQMMLTCTRCKQLTNGSSVFSFRGCPGCKHCRFVEREQATHGILGY